MIDSELIEKFYSKMFTIPKKRITISLGLITIFLASVLNGSVSKSFFAQRYFFIGLFTIAYLLISRRYIKLAFNSRRVFFLSLLVLMLIEIFDFVVIHAFDSFYLIVVAPSSATTLLTLTLYFTSESSERRVIFASLLILLALYPVNYLYSFQAPHRFIAYILTSASGLLLGYIFIKFLDRNYGIFNIKRLLKSFVLFWLTSSPDYFEKELEKTGRNERGWVKCLSVGDVKLISTSFHPGPMANVGGALLVPELLKRIQNSIYLHSPSKHESNPVSRNEVEKIISSVNCSGRVLEAQLPFEIEGKRFSLRVFPFNSLKMLIFCGKEAIDDIPPIIYRTSEGYFKEVILVDGHNAYVRNYDISAKDFFELEELLRKASEIKTEETKVNYFFRKKELNSDNVNFVAILLLDYFREKHAIIMLDGNNIVREFRDEIEEFMSSKGFKATVISTDNHSKTGVSTKIGYRPVGNSKDRKKVISFLEEVFENVEFRRAIFSYSKSDLTVKTMGRDFFDEIERAFNDVGERSLYLLGIIVVLQFLTALILGVKVL